MMSAEPSERTNGVVLLPRRCYRHRMRLALAIVVGVTVLAGCGHAVAAKDPLVGTWETRTPGWGVVIAKAEGNCVATMLFPTPVLPADPPPFTLTRSGDLLTGTMETDPWEQMSFRYVPSTGRLELRVRMYDDDQSPSPLITFSKHSDSTATPSLP